MTILHSVGAVLADTSRSRVYLQTMSYYGLAFENVLLLVSDKKRPGQIDRNEQTPFPTAWGNLDLNESALTTLQKMKTPCTILESDNINNSHVIDNVRACSCQVLVYSGFGGVLLRDEVLTCGKKFLHVHGGYLPDYKGSTTNYYSYLVDGTCGASAIFMTAELDSGPVLLRRKFFPKGNLSEFDHVQDSLYRAEVLCDVLVHYAKKGYWMHSQCEGEGKMFFIMHPLLRHMAICKSLGINHV